MLRSFFLIKLSLSCYALVLRNFSLKDSPHSCPPSHHGCANHGTGCRISFLGRLERHPTYHWKVLRFFSGNLHSQLFLITFCNLKISSKSESSKIQQNRNISYKYITCSPTHICWLCVDSDENFEKVHGLAFQKPSPTSPCDF